MQTDFSHNEDSYSKEFFMKTHNLKHQVQAALAFVLISIFSTGLLPNTLQSSVLPKGLRADLVTSLQNPMTENDFQPGLLSHSDDDLAALTIYLEARGESFAGKLAVAAVIRNRMKMKYQSDGTVQGTVLKAWQFEPWNKQRPHQVRINLNNRRMQDSILAWQLVQDGREVVDGALLFYNPRIARTPRWARLGHKVATIGGHEFYIPRRGNT